MTRPSLPVNRNRLLTQRPGGLSLSTVFTVAKRPLNSSASAVFQPIQSARLSVEELLEGRIVVSNIRQVDGQYVVLRTSPLSYLG